MIDSFTFSQTEKKIIINLWNENNEEAEKLNEMKCIQQVIANFVN